MRNNSGEYQKGVRKNYIAIICTRNPFKHFFTSYLPPAQFYTPETSPPLLTSLCPSQCLCVVSWVWSFFLVFKYIPCLGEKQHTKATRPKMGHLRVWPFLFAWTWFFFVFCFFFRTVCVCVSDILPVQFWEHRDWRLLSSQAVPYLQLQTSTSPFDILAQWLFPVIPVANLVQLKIGAGVRVWGVLHRSTLPPPQRWLPMGTLYWMLQRERL